MHTFFNKFLKKGKKTRSLSQIHQALIRHRLLVPGLRPYYMLFRHFRGLLRNIKLVHARKSRQSLEVPVPVFRLKSYVDALQIIYRAANARSAKLLSQRILAELHDITVNATQSTTVQAKDEYNKRVYEARVNIEKR
jgi:ribosomal protein S7